MSILDEIVANKRREVVAAEARMPLERLQEQAAARTDFRSLAQALGVPGVRVIAEIKRRSPSKGELAPIADPAELARTYQQGGAAALSVLTDLQYFGGTLADLQAARAAVQIPVLRKEFIVTEYQVYESKAAGADAILLIARILDPETLERLYRLAYSIGLEVLLEVHDPAELPGALALQAPLIGINNRNLASFHTDLGNATQMASSFQNSASMPIALSGIQSIDDIQTNLQVGIRHFLVGESLVRTHAPEALLQQFIQEGK